MKYLISVALIIASIFGGFAYFGQSNGVGGGLGTIEQLGLWFFDGTNITQNTSGTPVKLTGYESSGDCLVTNASGVLATSSCGGGGSSKWTDGGTVIYPTTGESIAVSSIAATGTATSTFTNLAVSGALNLFGTIGASLSSFCVAITGGSGLCDGSDDGSGGGSNWDLVSGGVETATSTDFARAAYFVASSTSATSTFTNTKLTHIQANTSAGVDIDSFNNTNVANFGIGSSANSLFYGGVNIDGATRLATSLSGILQATAGAVTATTTGTLTETVTGLQFDNTRALIGGSAILSLTSGYDIPLSASTTQWSGFYNTPSTRITAGNYLSWSSNILNASVQISTSSSNGALAFWTGSSALGSVATGTLTESVAGLELSATRGLVGGAAILALTSGYDIPLSASTSQWSGFYNTPSGRITAGNHIDWTGNTLDVITTGDWTGTIDGNNFAGGAIGAGDMLYGSGAGALAELTIGASSSLLYSNGSTPAWGAASSLCILITGSAALCDGGDATGGSGSGLATTSPWTNGDLAYVTGLGTVGSVATGTLTETVTGLEFNATRGLVGGAAILAITSGYGIPLTASTTEWSGFYNTPSTRITAGTGLSWSGNTLNATGGSGGDTAWATTTLLDGAVAQYPITSTVDILFGGSSTSTASFWFDKSATTTRLGNGGAGDSIIELAINSVAKWVFGADDSDSDAFVLSSGSALGTTNKLRVTTSTTTVNNTIIELGDGTNGLKITPGTSTTTLEFY